MGDLGVQKRRFGNILCRQERDPFAGFQRGIAANSDHKIHSAFARQRSARFEIADPRGDLSRVQIDRAFDIVKVQTEEHLLFGRMGIVKSCIHDQHGVLAQPGDQLRMLRQTIFL